MKWLRLTLINLLHRSNEFCPATVTRTLQVMKNVPCSIHGTPYDKCESRFMQAALRVSAVSSMSKLLPGLRNESSSFTTPAQDVLRPARGVIYALRLALVFWAVLGTVLLKLLVL